MHFILPELTVELFMCTFACRSIRTLLIASYKFFGGRRGRDRMVVGSTTTYAISAYHHWCCEFESRWGRGVQHYAI